jgi:hypothetical protein
MSMWERLQNLILLKGAESHGHEFDRKQIGMLLSGMETCVNCDKQLWLLCEEAMNHVFDGREISRCEREKPDECITK